MRSANGTQNQREQNYPIAETSSMGKSPHLLCISLLLFFSFYSMFLSLLIFSDFFFGKQLQRLYNLDARKFVIGNVGPIGCIPYQRTINRVNQDECVKLPNQLAVQYNGRLRDLLTELNENLPGATFALANVFDLVMELITNYAKYGGYYFFFLLFLSFSFFPSITNAGMWPLAFLFMDFTCLSIFNTTI